MLRITVVLLSFMLAACLWAGDEVKFLPTDEFTGPFPSWRDVKRDYGAKGDGAADDSDAINRALADLKKEQREFSVLYFPAGTYRITKTVTTSPCQAHHEGSGIAVVGEDPATTIIKWDGEDQGIVFSLWLSITIARRRAHESMPIATAQQEEYPATWTRLHPWRNRWRELPACDSTIYRKLEAHATEDHGKPIERGVSCSC